jgi:hypothetical protein
MSVPLPIPPTTYYAFARYCEVEMRERRERRVAKGQATSPPSSSPPLGGEIGAQRERERLAALDDA